MTKINLYAEEKLHNWLDTNGFYGYDPYDIYSQVPHFRKILYNENKVVKKSLARIYSLLDRWFPLEIRQILGVKKTINAKGMGLLGLGYLYRYLIKKENYDKVKIYQIAEWLIRNKNNKYPGSSWGYPFDWQSKIFIPEGTPSVVVSFTVGDFLLKAGQIFDEKKFLDVAISVCEFISKGLYQTKIDKETICFSYTPIDNFQVHNANLFGAEFLIRVGRMINNEDYINLGLMASNFALKEQLEDGSLNYWGNSQNTNQNNKNDHYHVGFEIRMLYSIGKIIGDKKIINSAEKYYEFYLRSFFYRMKDKIIPKMYPHKAFPLDIHACAESIILNTFIFELTNNYNSLHIADKSAEWIIKNMQNDDGSFAASKWKLSEFYWNVKIPYLRWGQAWMFYALNYLIYNQMKV